MGNRRFEMHQYRHIISRMRLGDSDRQIAKAKLMGRTKAAELRKTAETHGWLNPASPLPNDSELAEVLSRPTAQPVQLSTVDPFAAAVKSWFQQGVSNTVIHRALQEKHGFEGSYSSVRRFVQNLKRNQPPEATVMLDYDPGDTAQVDFGAGSTITDTKTGEIFKTWIFVMTLAWSRHQYVEIVRDQKILTWLGCHRRAFEFFGGVPAKVMIDNLKAAITKACWHDPAVQRSYADFAEGYGFVISPCPPYDPKKKGIVEAGVKYAKRNFLPLREFRSLADANQQITDWNLTTAAVRIHGTTRQKPIKLFLDTEKHLLKPLPDRAVEPAVWEVVKLHGNCHVQFEKSFYSAPYRWVRQELWLQATENTIKIFRDHQLVAVHQRARRPGQKFTCDDHLPPEALAYKMQDPQWCLKQADKIGPCCKTLIESLFNNGVLDNLRAAQGIVRTLKNKYNANRLEAACRRALFYDNPRYRTVKTILEKELDQLEEPVPTQLKLSNAYTGGGTFCRDANALLLQ
mgnify:CR=1 FL=1